MERLSVADFWLSAMLTGMSAFAPGEPRASQDPDDLLVAAKPDADHERAALGSGAPHYEFRLDNGGDGKLVCLLDVAIGASVPRTLETFSVASLAELTQRLEAIDVMRHLEDGSGTPEAGNLAVLKSARRRLLLAQHKSAFEFAKDDLLQMLERLEQSAVQLSRVAN